MELKQAVEKRVEEIEGFEEKSNDFQTLLDALPPGQINKLYKDEVCAGILEKYGVSKN